MSHSKADEWMLIGGRWKPDYDGQTMGPEAMFELLGGGELEVSADTTDGGIWGTAYGIADMMVDRSGDSNYVKEDPDDEDVSEDGRNREEIAQDIISFMESARFDQYCEASRRIRIERKKLQKKLKKLEKFQKRLDKINGN